MRASYLVMNHHLTCLLSTVKGCLILLASAFSVGAQDWEFDLSIGSELRFFPEDPVDNHQLEGVQSSIVFDSEWYVAFADQLWEITANPYYRHDFRDDERTHFDFRELHLSTWRDWGLFSVGFQRVFWGVTESQHLVDIINQTDLVESPDGEDKLGQPAILVQLTPEWGTLSFYALPYFREREFPGTEGRLRPGLQIVDDQTRFESSRESSHTDFAVRYSHFLGNIDIGLSYFNGTAREPILEPILSSESSEVVLRAFYPLMSQFGLDLQITAGGWLWKLEAIHRTQLDSDYAAATAGFEYTFVGVLGSDWDIGSLMELHLDSDGSESTNVFNNDLFVGLRFAANDAADTSLLIGWNIDMRNDTQFFRGEMSRRVMRNYTVDLEFQSTTNTNPTDPLFEFRRDSYFQLSLTRYF
jgi:hypothetical protein